MRRDGLDHEAAITTHGAGQFSGEVSQLAGRRSLAGGRAGPEGCTALPFDAAHLRALVIGSAEVGEVDHARLHPAPRRADPGGRRRHRAGRPRRVRRTSCGCRASSPATAIPTRVLDAAADEEGRALVERLGVPPDELPLMVCPNGTVLRRPTNAEVGVCLGITPELDPQSVYDVAVVGAGPAGLATAVYAASEGLSVLVLDQRAIGGQAGASARIENYLGFPTGISGQALAGRAFNQAQKFGAELAIPLEVARLDCGGRDRRSGAPLRLELTDGQAVQARTVVVASGARYRRPDIPNLATFEGAGVSYWASPVEAKLCEGEEVARGRRRQLGRPGRRVPRAEGQAPAPGRARQRARGDDVALPHRPHRRSPNVDVHVGTEVVALEGDRTGGLTAAVFRDRASRSPRTPVALRHLFLFIGADPNAAWLADYAAVDAKGFVLTGHDFPDGADAARRSALPLETSRPGVFAIGDVRAGSTKRVAAAVGEGAAVVAQIHAVLALQREQAASR